MAAASLTLRPLLTGPARHARVVAVTRAAAYLQTRQGVLALLTPDAVRLPFGLLLPDADAHPFQGLALDTDVEVGAGAVRVAGRRWTVSRWWTPVSVVPADVDPDLLDAVAELVPRAAAPGLAALEDRLFAALREVDPPGPLVRGMVGLGEGLTPEGDDVLAGLLVALRPGAVRTGLARSVLARLDRTTTVSAALLRQAVRGHAVPQLAAFVADPADAARRAALLAVGHTSGAALARGALMGLHAAAACDGRKDSVA